MGIEPTQRTWQARRLPLHHYCLSDPNPSFGDESGPRKELTPLAVSFELAATDFCGRSFNLSGQTLKKPICVKILTNLTILSPTWFLVNSFLTFFGLLHKPLKKPIKNPLFLSDRRVRKLFLNPIYPLPPLIATNKLSRFHAGRHFLVCSDWQYDFIFLLLHSLTRKSKKNSNYFRQSPLVHICLPDAVRDKFSPHFGHLPCANHNLRYISLNLYVHHLVGRVNAHPANRSRDTSTKNPVSLIVNLLNQGLGNLSTPFCKKRRRGFHPAFAYLIFFTVRATVTPWRNRCLLQDSHMLRCSQ